MISTGAASVPGSESDVQALKTLPLSVCAESNLNSIQPDQSIVPAKNIS